MPPWPGARYPGHLRELFQRDYKVLPGVPLPPSPPPTNSFPLAVTAHVRDVGRVNLVLSLPSSSSRSRVAGLRLDCGREDKSPVVPRPSALENLDTTLHLYWLTHHPLDSIRRSPPPLSLTLFTLTPLCVARGAEAILCQFFFYLSIFNILNAYFVTL
jgi:hypothetical protein